jgi:CheY-like chemotaxis protein
VRIAVPEDDAAQTELIQSWFREADHDCHAFAAGSEVKSALQHETFDLLVIDRNLPDTSGPDVLAWVREHLDRHIPGLFVTSRDHEEDIVFALEHGADDYMTKPVKRRETLARVAALERCSLPPGEQGHSLRHGPFEFDIAFLTGRIPPMQVIRRVHNQPPACVRGLFGAGGTDTSRPGAFCVNLDYMTAKNVTGLRAGKPGGPARQRVEHTRQAPRTQPACCVLR